MARAPRVVVRMLDEEEAEEVVDGQDVAKLQVLSEHRWYTSKLVVFDLDDGSKAGFVYMDPASELQEGQDRFEAVPVPCYAVVEREVVTTVYDFVEGEAGG